MRSPLGTLISRSWPPFLPPRSASLSFGLDVEAGAKSRRFYFFDATWDNPEGSVMFGIYAVDKRTGDIWVAPVACEEISTPAVRKLQATFRSKIGLTPADYKRSKGTCPLETQE